MREQSAVEKAVAVSRELDPDLWAKVDRVAEIIDPGAFALYYDSVDPDGKPVPMTLRQKYMQSAARTKAWVILRRLGEIPQDFDWTPVLERLFDAPSAFAATTGEDDA